MEVKKFNSKYYDKVNKIYEESFPVDERYMPLEEMIKVPNTELHCLTVNDEVYGFIYTIKHNKSIFILYLAVDEQNRSKSYGSHLLAWCVNNYKGCNIYLNIDELSPQKPDYLTRIKRLKFYQKNGFYLSNVQSIDEYEHFHVLSTQKNVDLQEYIDVDNFVAKVLDADLSRIEVIDISKVMNAISQAEKVQNSNTKKENREDAFGRE